jgi:hypothetical protein
MLDIPTADDAADAAVRAAGGTGIAIRPNVKFTGSLAKKAA